MARSKGKHRVEQFRERQGAAIVAEFRLGAIAFAVYFLQDSGSAVEVGQTGDSAQLRAGAERHHDARFAAHQAGHLQLMAGAHGAVYETDGDLAIGHAFYILLFEIQGDGPEDDIHGGGHVQDLLAKIQHGLLAAAARGAPVERNLGFHATSIR